MVDYWQEWLRQVDAARERAWEYMYKLPRTRADWYYQCADISDMAHWLDEPF